MSTEALSFERPDGDLALRAVPWVVLGVLLLVCGAALQHRHPQDVALFLQVQALARRVPDALWAGLSVCGLGWTAVLLCAAASRRDAWPIAAMLWALLLGGLLLHALKVVHPMPRPPSVLAPELVHVVGARLYNGSLPSGHAAAAATVAVLLAWRRGARPRLRAALGLAFAALVGTARMAVGVHWPSDVLVGAGMGVLMALLALRLEARWPLRHRLQRPGGQALVALLQIAAGPGLVLQGHDPLGAPVAWALGAASALDGLRRLAAAARGWRQARRARPLAAVPLATPAGPAQHAGPPAQAQALPGAAWIAWGLAVALLFLLRLGAAPLFDVDEGAFAEATREMLASGDWWHTTLNGADRFDKPILVYWLQALSVALLGPGAAAVRLPTALCAIGWCWATAQFLRPRAGDRAALAAGSLLACSLGVLLIGRASTADGLLNLLLALSMFDLWRHLESGSAAPLRRAAAWIALAVLTKGPIGLLVPGATLLLWALARRRPGALRSVLGDAPAWALLLALALPWYAYALHRHGRAFIDGFVMRHNVERFTGTLEGHGGSLLYYVLVLPLLALPWTPLLAAPLGRLRALWREPAAAWLLLWAGFVFGFFSLSGTKLPHYVLYGLTPLALLAGPCLADPGLGRGWRRALAASWGLAALLFALAPWLLVRAAPRVPEGLWRTLVTTAPRPPWAATAAVLAGAAVVVALLRRQAWWQRWLGACFVLGLLVVGVTVPWFGQTLQGPLCHLAAVARAQPALPAVVQWGVNQPSFAWCLGVPTPRRDPQPGEWVLLRSDRPPPGGPYEVCAQERGFELWRRRADGAGAAAACR